MSILIGFGVMLTATHGAPFNEKHKEITPVDFTSNVIRDLHIHNDFTFVKDRVLLDPRSLRNVRSDGEKMADLDMRDIWDVYRA